MNPLITKATDLELLPEDVKEMIRNICNQDPSDKDIENLAFSLDITELFPIDRIGDVFRTWLKVTGYLKHKGSEDNQISIISWIDTEAQAYIDGNENISFKPSQIRDKLESRLAVVSEMFLKTSELFDLVKEKMQKDYDVVVATFESIADPEYLKEANNGSSD